jgi:hypothetical protein
MDIVQGQVWKPLQLLVWIASRDKSLADRFNGIHFVEDAEGAVMLSRGENSPNQMSMAEAFSEVLRRYNSLTPLKGEWVGVRYCNIYDFNVLQLLVSPDEAMRLWPSHWEVRALRLALDRPWRKPTRSAATWARQLPNRGLIPLVQVLDVVASRESRGSIELVDEQAVLFSVCICILEAAAKSRIRLFGTPCRRSIKTPHRLEQAESRIEIEAPVAATLSPVLDGDSDWLGPSEYARTFELNGHAPGSVSFSRVVVDRKSLLSWLSEHPKRTLSEREVEEKIRAAQRERTDLSIGEIVRKIRTEDPYWPRDQIAAIAKRNGVFGQRGRPKKFAETIPRDG